MSQSDLSEGGPAIELPWYKDRAKPPPFSLIKKISSNNRNAPPFKTISFFPWMDDSLNTLWNGSLNSPDMTPDWETMISEFSDAVAVGADQKAYIFFTQRSKKPICISLPEDKSSGLKALPTDAVHVAWALNPNLPIEPLLIISHLSRLYVYNIRRKGIASYLRGHGGAITSVVVHPTTTNLFCTTSRDFSTRIYDLTLEPASIPVNLHWPPGTQPSLAGAAHGLQMTGDEGSGMGRCILVLAGGRSGGHQASVLGAAFHPDLPLLATCGLDRTVKIWFVRPTSKVMMGREDKPLFSSSRIHKARVLSVTWLQSDLLLTHSAPALMREKPNDTDAREMYLEPGQMIIWRWLGVDRFFPATAENRQDVLRGCASDYQESSSFTIISAVSFPKVPTQYIVPHIHVNNFPGHDPMVLYTYPNSTSVSLINLVHIPPQKPPPFPPDEEELVETAQRMNLGGQDDPSNRRVVDKARHESPEVSPWRIGTVSDETQVDNEGKRLTACAMGMQGKIVLGVGVQGNIWIWKERPC